MRKLIIASAVAATLTFGGCSTLTTLTPANVTSLLAEVSAVTRVACGAVPAAAVIATLINAGIGASAGALAAAFCGAFQTAVPVAPVASSSRFGFGARRYMCAGNICGWKV